MAFSCSNFGLYNSTYLHGDGSTGVNFSSGQSRKGGVKVRGFGFQRSPAAECSLFLKAATFPAFFRVERSGGGVCSKKRKWGFEIRIELQHPIEADSTDTTITIQQEGGDVSLKKEARALESDHHSNLDFGNGGMGHPDGSGGSGKTPPGGWGGDGGRNDGDHEKNNREEDEFGPILKFDEVIREAEKQGASLPSDMLEAAKTVGIQKVLLLRYLELQVFLHYFARKLLHILS